MFSFFPLITSVAAAVGSALAIGQGLDSLPRGAQPKFLRRLRVRLIAWSRRAEHLTWRNYVAMSAYQLYSRLFDKKSSTRKFLVRSVTFYLAIFAIFFLFLSIFFPDTFASVTSVFKYGSFIEIFSWSFITMVGGAFVFTLANAQTLYFLEILTQSPSGFKFFLVAYSDLIITSSIGLIFIPILLLIYSYVNTSLAQHDVTISFDFGRHATLTDEEGYREFRGASDRQQYTDYFANLAYVNVPMSPNIVFQPSRNAELAYHEDFDMLANRVASGEYLGIIEDEKIKLLDDLGTVISIRHRDPESQRNRIGFGSEWPAHSINGYSRSVAEAIAEYCNSFGPPEYGSAHPTYTIVGASSESISTIREACNNFDSTEVDLIVSINSSAVDWGSVYSNYVMQTIASYGAFITNGGREYQIVPPYNIVRSFPNFYEHTHTVGVQLADSGIPQFDIAALSALNFEMGAHNFYLNRALPAGTLNAAVMSTTFFNLLVMIYAGLLAPTIRYISSVKNGARHIARHTFLIYGWIVGIYLFGIIAGYYLLLELR